MTTVHILAFRALRNLVIRRPAVIGVALFLLTFLATGLVQSTKAFAESPYDQPLPDTAAWVDRAHIRYNGAIFTDVNTQDENYSFTYADPTRTACVSVIYFITQGIPGTQTPKISPYTSVLKPFTRIIKADTSSNDTSKCFTVSGSNPKELNLQDDANKNITPPPTVPGESIPLTPADACEQSKGDGLRLKYLLCGAIGVLADTATKLENFILDQVRIPVNQIFDTPGISNGYHAAWGAFRNIALILLVIIALIMVASQVLGLELFDAYTVRKMLPKLILATLFVFLSWPAQDFLYHAADAATTAVDEIIKAPFNSFTVAEATGYGDVGFGFLIATLSGVIGGTAAVIYAGLLGYGGVMLLLTSGVLAIVSAVILLAIRNVAAIALIIFAPIAIICYAFEPLKKVFTFWWGLSLTILLSVPAFAALLAFSRVGAKLAYIAGSPVTAFVILVAGLAASWALWKQLDKASGAIGNVMSKATGAAQKFLADRRQATVGRRQQEVVEGRRNIIGGGLVRRAHAASEGKPWFGAGFEGAEQHETDKAASKMLEHDRGRYAGDDIGNSAAAEAHDAKQYIEIVVKLELEKEIAELKKKLMAANPTMSRDDAEEQARNTVMSSATNADMQRRQSEAYNRLRGMETSYGGLVGTHSFQVAAFKAKNASPTGYSDDPVVAWKERMDDITRLTSKGIITETDAVLALKSNKARADQSSVSFGTLMNRVATATKRVGSREPLVSEDEITQMLESAVENVQPGQLIASRPEAITALSNTMVSLVAKAGARKADAEAALAAAQQSNDAGAIQQAQAAIDAAETERKRQIAAIANRYDVLGQSNPDNANRLANGVLVKVAAGSGTDRAGNPLTIQQEMDNLRDDAVFRRYRREYYGNAAARGEAPPPIGV